MKITIRSLTGVALELEVEPDTTLLAVKQQIEAHWDLPVEQQRIIFAGKQLEEVRTVGTYHIQGGATLHLVVRTGHSQRAPAAVEALSERTMPSQKEIEHKLHYWRSAFKSASFEDDLDIIDPNAFYRRLELLSDAVAEHSEFKRCGGQYTRLDENTWAIGPAAAAGVVPTPPFEGVPDWMGSVFGDVAPDGSSEKAVSTDGVLASLWKTCLIFSRVASSFRELERQGFCNGSFNLLLSHPGDNIAELVRIPVVEIENIRQGAISYLEAAFSEEGADLDEDVQASLWAYILEPCKLLLERLNLPLELPDQSTTSILITGRVTALLLDLALLSYTGSHGCRFDQDYLQLDARAFEVNWEDSPVNFRCSLTQLACLNDFLDKKEVWVFELRGGRSAPAPSLSNRPLDVLTNMADFADIWGPVYAVPEPKGGGRIRQYNVSKGIICKVKGRAQTAFPNAVRCHWHSHSSWMRGLAMKLLPPSEDLCLSPDDLLLIGDVMTENHACRFTLDHYEAGYGNLMGELGTKDSEWRWDTRGVSGTLSKIFGVTISGTQKRIPQTPLKEKILDKWKSVPERRNPQVLNQYLGVEVSHCTGNARRISVRGLLVLKPVALLLERQFPGWRDEVWGREFEAAIESSDDEAIENVWIKFKDQRAEMAQLVCYALDLLSPTGMSDSKLKVGFFNNGQEGSLDLEVGLNTWATLLKDTPLTAAFAIINERCLRCHVPDHSASACSTTTDGLAMALTMMESRISIPAFSGWKRVLVKSSGERYRRVEIGSSSIVLLASESNFDQLVSRATALRDTAVDAVEVRYRAFRWGEMTDVYIQASEPSYGGMRSARIPLPASVPPAQNVTATDFPHAETPLTDAILGKTASVTVEQTDAVSNPALPVKLRRKPVATSGDGGRRQEPAQ
ncbi:uncharacterized protein DNG_04029 [Cephalotrichum gorgonifer]|uniref:Ubiquitin-like domain-containing protein n=1 Tax=Cephalotrichum gorgonifer TaxID=2041049 RepID=A0AAE8MVT6_9PEZI|nr:uncharacterized protein DNG_04029 [Cephalotrichum gorgonifer]